MDNFKKRIFVTHKIPDRGIALLRKKHYEVDINPLNGVLPKEKLISLAKDKDVILSLLSDTIDKEVMRECRNLKVISNYAVGFNNIDIDEATERGIYVTNTPRTLDGTTSDFILALILSISRRIVEADKFMRSGKYEGWGALDFLGRDVFNSTLGIIGMGSIGKEVALKGYHGFNMKILYSDKSVKPDSIGINSRQVNLQTLLKESDFVTLNVPLNADTYHLIGKEELGMMKKTSYLINTSRGAVIDENALLKALEENLIAGAALDVYEDEPRFTPGLEKLDNIIMTPHIASASFRTRELMACKAAQNIINCLEGKMPEGLVNRNLLNKKPLLDN